MTDRRTNIIRCILAALVFMFAHSWSLRAENTATSGTTKGEERHFSAGQVFDYSQTILFQNNFQSGQFGNFNFSENANYRIPDLNPARISIVDAPGLDTGRKAVRFAVLRAPDSFRSEISLPYEKGFKERWYSERMLIPKDWVIDPNRAADILMQWHAIPGNWQPTHPNLAIVVQNTNWFIRQTYGSAQTKPTRTNICLDAAVTPGTWVSWVIHAKWSPGTNGLLQIWKDGIKVADLKGPNVYSTIGVEYTPYLKTGIYHPEWHLDNDRKRELFNMEIPAATNKVIYVTDVKVGSEHARYQAIADQMKPDDQ